VGTSFGETALPIDEEPAPAREREDPLRGAVFGDMVHNILEQIDFAEVARAKGVDDLIATGTHARKLMDAEVRRNVAKLRARLSREQLEQACRAQIAPLVFNCLCTPLSAAGIRLCDVPAQDRLHEVEFQFPVHAGPTASAEVRPEDAFITGFIDLLFRAGDKYYLVDFKTNLLTGYGREPIERCMHDSDYHRQYQLYVHAAKRWFERVFGRRFSFARQFGGIYYLFVRGLNGVDDSAGVFYHLPTRNDLDLDRVLSQ
jgi:exodeoxyribonuclease V beta subunit